MSLQSSNNFDEDRRRRDSGQSDYDSVPASRKRIRLNDDETNDHLQTFGAREADYTQPKKKLSHADYTIAWICALSLELKAARYMLDEEHEALPVAPSDENVYILGTIAGHNVVMTSLRAGVYGLVSATAVGKDILATFSNVKSIPLLVGIGGGCPSPLHDIRLGDVVVSKPTSESPAIRQYDFGKIVHSGKLEIKGSNNKPAPVLLNAIANLEAKHDSLGEQIQTHITKACQKYGTTHKHPGTNLDVLFEPEHEHLMNNTPLKPVSRKSRGSLCPEVHFGPIASGNQVMKDAITRSRLALEHGFLCFEMEAAGLMDFLPCLVIRGISDYCDSSKHKQFQTYAALTAAAFAKELISVLPKKITMVEQIQKPTADKLEHRKLIMEALDFIESDNRRATIKKAHHQTCRWLSKQQEYINWREHWKVDINNALLWIKGNPGTGKSTIMKFVLEEIEEHKSKNDIVISFFFNARGEPLERTIEGLYRSLVVQLLSQVPDLQWLLEKIPVTDSRGNVVLDRIVNLFRSILRTIHGREVICLVDALDECSEQEIRDMLNEFVAILEHSGTEPNVRVLFSSRHYPHISIEVGQSFVLEKQDGHANDLTKYIEAELKIGKTKQADKLKKEVFDKANGIFLWVVLVVNILKREYDRGRIHDMTRRVKEIPVELNQLFKEILLRDSNNINELVLCIQWCLYSQRPLNREEFYFAMLAGNDSITIGRWDKEEDTEEIMDKFILDCSKGLAEMTRGKKPVVQFIHESVREFFLAPDTLSSLSNDFHDITQAGVHEKLRNCCYRLLSSEALDFLILSEKPKSKWHDVYWQRLRPLSSPFPFLDYAASFVLHHADKAGQSGHDQAQFLQDFCAPRWIRLYNIVQRYRMQRIWSNQFGILTFLVHKRLQRLLVLWLDTHSFQEGDIHSLLKICASDKGEDTTKWLLSEHGQRIFSQTGDMDSVRFELFIDLLLDDFLLAKQYQSSLKQRGLGAVNLPRWIWTSTVGEMNDENTKKLIEFAAVMKRSKALEFLLDATYPLHQRLESEFAQALLDRVFEYAGRRCYALASSKPELRPISEDSRATPMADVLASLDADTKACIEILISRGARIEGIDKPGNIIRWAGLDTISFLLQQDLLWIRKSFLAGDLGKGKNILHKAIEHYRRPTHIQSLIHGGAEVNAKDVKGATPLLSCATQYSGPSNRIIDLLNAQILINHGAQLDRISQAYSRYNSVRAKLNTIGAMVPQTPCCVLSDQTDTVPQSPDVGVFTGSSADRPEQFFNNGFTGDDIHISDKTIEIASTWKFSLDDWSPFENWPEMDDSPLQPPGDWSNGETWSEDAIMPT